MEMWMRFNVMTRTLQIDYWQIFDSKDLYQKKDHEQVEIIKWSDQQQLESRYTAITIDIA